MRFPDQVRRHIIGQPVPAGHIARAGSEKVGAGTVFPRLEIHAEIAVVFCAELIDSVLNQRFGRRSIILFKHTADVPDRSRGRIEQQRIEPRVGPDGIDTAVQLDAVAGTDHADLPDQFRQRNRVEILRIVEEVFAPLLRFQVRLIEFGYDGVDAHAVLDRFEPVFLGRDDQHAGSVRVLDRFDFGQVRIDPARADRRHDVRPDLIRIGVFEDIDLRVDKRIVVRVDEGDLLRLLTDLDVEPGLNLGRQRCRRRRVPTFGRSAERKAGAEQNQKQFSRFLHGRFLLFRVTLRRRVSRPRSLPPRPEERWSRFRPPPPSS